MAGDTNNVQDVFLWDRVARAWDAICRGKGVAAASARGAIEAAYSRGETDEFIAPSVIDSRGVRDGDAVVFFNFRADRARQLTRAFTEPGFSEFDRGEPPSVFFVCFTEYKQEFALPVAFPTPKLERILAAAWADAGVRNLRLAETEKYAHVTYFFNGGVETPYPGEERLLVPSWKGATYDLHPQMSAVIVVLKTPYFAATDKAGAFRIPDVPAGQYELHVFHERATSETLRALDRKLTVENAALEVPPVALSESGYLQVEHKNKFGKDYPPVAEEQPAYTGVRK